MSKKKSAKKRTVSAAVASTKLPVTSDAPQARASMPTTPRATSVTSASRSGGKVMPLKAASAEAIAQAQSGFADEYRYVFTDLKRIGVIAAGMFTLLVALALIVR